MTKSSKFLSYVNYRMKATMVDGRVLIGKFMAFDRHMNIVMADTDEYRFVILLLCLSLPFPRKLKPKNGKEREEKRTVGFVIVRGDTIVSLSVFGPPPNDSAKARVNPAGMLVTIRKRFWIVTLCWFLLEQDWPLFSCCGTPWSGSSRWSWSSPCRYCCSGSSGMSGYVIHSQFLFSLSATFLSFQGLTGAAPGVGAPAAAAMMPQG